MYSSADFSNTPSFFKTSAAQAKMEEAYQTIVERLPGSSELVSIDTSFGLTNVVRMGITTGPALVLLHARNSCAPLMLRHFLALLPDFRIYAIDLPGHPNLSSEMRLLARTNAYGQWMYEVLSKLGIWHANLVGIDIGAYAVLKSLLFDARRIAAAYLITPLGLHTANRWQHYWQFQRPLQRYIRTPSPLNLRELADQLWQAPDEDMLSFWAAVLPDYTPDSSYLPSLNHQALSKLTTPIYCFIGSNESYFSKQETFNQIPSLRSTIILPNFGYLPSPSAFPLIIEHIKNTFHEHRTAAE